jgi:hypothetical protein
VLGVEKGFSRSLVGDYKGNVLDVSYFGENTKRISHLPAFLRKHRLNQESRIFPGFSITNDEMAEEEGLLSPL